MRQNYQISEQFPSKEEEEALGFPLFAQKDYWLLHLLEKAIVPITIRNHSDKIIAFWCFCIKENRLITPFKAPFFTPYIKVGFNETDILIEVIEFCKKQYSLPLQFTLASRLNLDRIQQLDNSFRIQNVELGTRLIVENGGFIDHVSRKRKGRKLGSLISDFSLEVEEVSSQEWRKVYDKNLIWRKEKGHQNFMSIDEMEKAKTQFPQSYHAFQLKKNGDLVGTAFFLMIDENLIYVYSLITIPAIDSEEASLLLWNAVYDWAQVKKVSIIDIGTSMLPEGGVNKNLAHYKQFIGGVHYKKYTFEC